MNDIVKFIRNIIAFINNIYNIFVSIIIFTRKIKQNIGRFLNHYLPKGLYTRTLLIIILPMVTLQGVLAYVFMERHWQAVTSRLSSALAQEIALIIDVYEQYPQDNESRKLSHIADMQLSIDIDFIPLEPLPPPVKKPFFDILDQALSSELRQKLKRPFWIDSVGSSSVLEIRVPLKSTILRVIARRSQAYASNSHIFLVWMVGSSLILLGISVIFLRNQIRPILALADVAEEFGKGRRDINFRPHGAREVRRAGLAFVEMKNRIERTMEQRTMMLNGVSHDLRTILTRLRLSIALLPENQEIEDMRRDVDEMSKMLEGYLSFARIGIEEQTEKTDIRNLLEEFRIDAERSGHFVSLKIEGDPIIEVRPQSFRRLLGNLVVNASRYGDKIEITALHDARFLTMMIDDDGFGIPEELREEAFKPFSRLDQARNQDNAGTGLGLSITRDIVRAHGGEVFLEDSPLGGLRVRLKIPA